MIEIHEPRKHRPCAVCKGMGFYARPCPGCSRQLPLDARHAQVYSLPEGTLRPVPEQKEEQR